MYSLLLFLVVYYVWTYFHFVKICVIYAFANTIDFNYLILFRILVNGIRLALKHDRSKVLKVWNFTPF